MAEDNKTEMVTTPEVTEMVTDTNKTEASGMDAAAELENTRAALKKANAEAAKYRKAVEAAEADKKAREEAEMTELQKAQKRLAELETAYAAKELAERKRVIAEKNGLPPALAVRLQGTSDEELEQDAKALLESIPKPADKQKPSGINPTNPSNASADETREQKKARLAGRPIDVFGKGGGIMWGEKPEG